MWFIVVFKNIYYNLIIILIYNIIMIIIYFIVKRIRKVFVFIYMWILFIYSLNNNSDNIVNLYRINKYLVLMMYNDVYINLVFFR